jgi:DNA-binding GntR family transcriptional regulator
MATRLTVPRLTADALTGLESLINRICRHMRRLAKLKRLNSDLHRAMYWSAGRRRLSELDIKVRLRTAHYFHACAAYMITPGRMPMAPEERRPILSACRPDGADEAADLVPQHVFNVGQSVIVYVQSANRDDQF